MPGPRPIVNKPPTPGALKGNPLQKGLLAGQRKKLAMWKSRNAKTPEMAAKFKERAQNFGQRSRAFTNRATGATPTPPSNNAATNPGARTPARTNPNLFRAQTSAKRNNPAATQKWLNRAVGLK